VHAQKLAAVLYSELLTITGLYIALFMIHT